MKEEKKHSKHTALIKPIGGEYHRNEWAILGAPCDRIDQLVKALNKILSSTFKIGYLDAAHNAAEDQGRLFTEFTDNISFQSFTTKNKPEQKQARKFFNNLDLLFVNGNHFLGAKQIVILNEKKKESLSRKLDRLSDVQILVKDGAEQYEFLEEKLKNKPISFSFEETDKIAQFLKEEMQKTIPPLHGLVLAGGKSQRMGQDKGGLEYRNKAHREFTADLIQPHCEKTFISIRKIQKDNFKSSYAYLYDSFTGLGPYGAILSAFREHPNHACLSIACDLPFIDTATITHLVEQRNPSKLATCFHNPETNFPEPLITIWEPRAYPVLLEFLSQGYSCPRKVLINSEIKEIQMCDTRAMKNANDPAAYKNAKEILVSNPIKE